MNAKAYDDAVVYLYTDGAASGNPGPGAYAAILQYGTKEKVLVQAYRSTTNNRMELKGMIKGLEALKGCGWRVAACTDSRYLVDAVNKGWLVRWLKEGFKKIKNEDLWRRFWCAYQRHRVVLQWIKGHNGHPQNERCDRLAVQAYKEGVAGKCMMAVDSFYEQKQKPRDPV